MLVTVWNYDSSFSFLLSVLINIMAEAPSMSSSCSQGFPLEVVNMINEVKELESQEKTVWSEKMKKNIWRGPVSRPDH